MARCDVDGLDKGPPVGLRQEVCVGHGRHKARRTVLEAMLEFAASNTDAADDIGGLSEGFVLGNPAEEERDDVRTRRHRRLDFHGLAVLKDGLKGVVGQLTHDAHGPIVGFDLANRELVLTSFIWRLLLGADQFRRHVELARWNEIRKRNDVWRSTEVETHEERHEAVKVHFICGAKNAFERAHPRFKLVVVVCH